MKRQQGFTLIELMIVVAVIGVLSAIAIPAYQDYVKKGALASALSTATALKTPVEQYIADNGSFPADDATEIKKPTFSLGKITLAPVDNSQNGSIEVELESTSAINATVTWTKTDDGWACALAGDNISGITLNGCPQAAAPEEPADPPAAG
ncbi:pilin [Photobacterium lucens]|uniref:pilin n=1 Tax=Photobacterium lucens TaxID=2562949 RepID=UPI00136D06C7|nr:pilin [Photobacterium lucens]MBP2700579.1 prepilin-type N-terminal cleavage/methylation domain-containing protein [Vibrio parahaemolyticus]MZG58355.1 prepilin-type N-terminal cleavage/methylation domain-containing protein [Photobacterium lucens]MZG81839.1 prepilin-type N-terminal cleavage/methylation domain-containing protein [Photobacterium lucens]